jgi:RHS repeat-associated protein
MKGFRIIRLILIYFFFCLLFYGKSEAQVDLSGTCLDGIAYVGASYSTDCSAPWIPSISVRGFVGPNTPGIYLNCGSCYFWSVVQAESSSVVAEDNVYQHVSVNDDFVMYEADCAGAPDGQPGCALSQQINSINVYIRCPTGACCVGNCQCLNSPFGSSANYASGNLYDTRDIISTRGTGLPLSFSLSYNSLDGSFGRLGWNWTHNYNSKIMVAGDTLILIEGDGKRSFFMNDGTGIYHAPQNTGDYSTVELNSGQYELTKKDGTVYSFDATSGNLLSITDRNGNSITLTYTNGYLTSVSDAYGRSIGLTYDSTGRITTVTDFASRATHINYNASGMLSSITDPAGNSWHYTYDPYGKMLSKTDPAGYVTTYAYDLHYRISSSTNPAGTKTISYGTNNTTTITERDGSVWTYKYDPMVSAPLEVTGPDNGKTTSTYDANGNLLSKTEPNGNVTTYTYDSYGNMLSMTDALNNTATYTYNQWGQVTSVTDQQGNVTTNTYDSNGNLISTTDPSGGVTQYQYDSKGNVTSVTTPLGQVTTMTYDQYGNPATVTDPTGSVSTLTYDISGNMLSQTDALGNTTTFEYNVQNQLVNVIDSQGNETSYTYDADGNRTSAMDANENVTFYEYNYNNQPVRVTDPLDNVTTYTYGSTGCPSCGGGTDKLTSVTDANNHIIRYQYDPSGRLSTMTDQLGNIETYAYDLNGNLITLTDRKGQVTSYIYDSLNRMTRATYADGSYTTYAYDSTDKVTTITDSISGTITYTYSTANSGMPVGKVINETTSQGSISYTYDTIGRRTSMTATGQPAVYYTYDLNNRLTDINTTINGVNAGFSLSFDALGRRTEITLPNGLMTNYTYDNASRLLNLEHLNPAQQVLESLTYTYDANGNRISMNRASVTPPWPQPISNTSYNAANQMLTFNDKNITYDANGNMTSVTNSCGTTNYTWDVRNRLIGISGYKSDCSTLSATFGYDAIGRRIQKTINGTTTQYIYDEMDIIQEKQNGSVTANYIRSLNIDEPLARIKSDGTIRYYQTDALGSVIALTDETGVVKTTYTYDPFGNVTVSGEASDNPFQYTGRENDNTGLYYYRARYYSPDLQRFISEDPIGVEGGINLFAYAKNNPIGFRDPMGLIVPPRTPGGDCIKCDYGAIATCMWQAPATPPSTLACFICVFSGFTNIPSCTVCGGAVGIITIECFRKNCHSGKWNKCGQCE